MATINFPARFKLDLELVAARAAASTPAVANPNPATPRPVADKPHYNLIDEEFFAVESF